MLAVWMFTSILGMTVELKQISEKERLERKKYMGVWRWGSELMARIMSRCPNMVTTNMDRKSPNKMGCCSES